MASKTRKPETEEQYSAGHQTGGGGLGGYGNTALILNLLNTSANRNIDSTRYATKSRTDSMREVANNYGNMLAGLPDAYFKGAKFRQDSEKHASDQRLSAEELKRREIESRNLLAEEQLLNGVAPNGRTRREQIYMNQHGYTGLEKDWLHGLENDGYQREAQRIREALLRGQGAEEQQLLAQAAPQGQGQGQPQAMTRWQQSQIAAEQAKLAEQQRKEMELRLAQQELALKGRQTDIAAGKLSIDRMNAEQDILRRQREKALNDASAMFAEAGNNPEAVSQIEARAKASGLTDADLASARIAGKDLRNKNRTELQTVRDRKAAEMASEWLEGGNRGNVIQAVNNLKMIEGMLSDGRNMSGSIIGRLPGQDIFNQSGVKAKDIVDSIKQMDLKKTLGGQFTQREGEMVLERAYRTTNDEKENLRRVKDLRELMEQEIANKDKMIETIEKYGSLDQVKSDIGFTNELRKKARDGQIEVKLKNGKTGIFDVNTKKFLRYKD